MKITHESSITFHPTGFADELEVPIEGKTLPSLMGDES